jgi:hypothetical protein
MDADNYCTYRVPQEERSVIWEFTVSAILSKECTCTRVLFRTVSEIELFRRTVVCTWGETFFFPLASDSV